MYRVSEAQFKKANLKELFGIWLKSKLDAATSLDEVSRTLQLLDGTGNHEHVKNPTKQHEYQTLYNDPENPLIPWELRMYERLTLAHKQTQGTKKEGIVEEQAFMDDWLETLKKTKRTKAYSLLNDCFNYTQCTWTNANTDFAKTLSALIFDAKKQLLNIQNKLSEPLPEHTEEKKKITSETLTKHRIALRKLFDPILSEVTGETKQLNRALNNLLTLLLAPSSISIEKFKTHQNQVKQELHNLIKLQETQDSPFCSMLRSTYNVFVHMINSIFQELISEKLEAWISPQEHTQKIYSEFEKCSEEIKYTCRT